MFKQIIPATDWFYTEHNKSEDSVLVAYIAAWGLEEKSGDTFGLIAVSASKILDDENKCPKLVKVPSTGIGKYKHINQLNAAEKMALKSGGVLRDVSKLKSLEEA